MTSIIAVAISLAAFALTLYTFIHSRQIARRDLLLNLQDQLLAPDRQEGRRVLFEMSEKGLTPQDLSAEEFRLVNHSLAMLDALGFLYVRRYIAQSDALDLWGATTARAYVAAESCGFIALRDIQHQEPIWPYLRQFADTARASRGEA